MPRELEINPAAAGERVSQVGQFNPDTNFRYQPISAAIPRQTQDGLSNLLGQAASILTGVDQLGAKAAGAKLQAARMAKQLNEEAERDQLELWDLQKAEMLAEQDLSTKEGLLEARASLKKLFDAQETDNPKIQTDYYSALVGINGDVARLTESEKTEAERDLVNSVTQELLEIDTSDTSNPNKLAAMEALINTVPDGPPRIAVLRYLKAQQSEVMAEASRRQAAAEKRSTQVSAGAKNFVDKVFGRLVEGVGTDSELMMHAVQAYTAAVITDDADPDGLMNQVVSQAVDQYIEQSGVNKALEQSYLAVYEVSGSVDPDNVALGELEKKIQDQTRDLRKALKARVEKYISDNKDDLIQQSSNAVIQAATGPTKGRDVWWFPTSSVDQLKFKLKQELEHIDRLASVDRSQYKDAVKGVISPAISNLMSMPMDPVEKVQRLKVLYNQWVLEAGSAGNLPEKYQNFTKLKSEMVDQFKDQTDEQLEQLLNMVRVWDNDKPYHKLVEGFDWHPGQLPPQLSELLLDTVSRMEKVDPGLASQMAQTLVELNNDFAEKYQSEVETVTGNQRTLETARNDIFSVAPEKLWPIVDAFGAEETWPEETRTVVEAASQAFFNADYGDLTSDSQKNAVRVHANALQATQLYQATGEMPKAAATNVLRGLLRHQSGAGFGAYSYDTFRTMPGQVQAAMLSTLSKADQTEILTRVVKLNMLTANPEVPMDYFTFERTTQIEGILKRMDESDDAVVDELATDTAGRHNKWYNAVFRDDKTAIKFTKALLDEMEQIGFSSAHGLSEWAEAAVPNDGVFGRQDRFRVRADLIRDQLTSIEGGNLWRLAAQEIDEFPTAYAKLEQPQDKMMAATVSVLTKMRGAGYELVPGANGPSWVFDPFGHHFPLMAEEGDIAEEILFLQIEAQYQEPIEGPDKEVLIADLKRRGLALDTEVVQESLNTTWDYLRFLGQVEGSTEPLKKNELSIDFASPRDEHYRNSIRIPFEQGGGIPMTVSMFKDGIQQPAEVMVWPEGHSLAGQPMFIASQARKMNRSQPRARFSTLGFQLPSDKVYYTR